MGQIPSNDMENNTQGGNSPFDLSELAGFQFGPSWARPGASKSSSSSHSEPRGERFNRRPSGDNRDGRSFKRNDRDSGSRPPFKRENRDGARPFNRDDRRDNRRDGGARFERPVRELPEPAAGLRVELRPSNSILELISQQVVKQKRVLPLIELAKLVMASPDRYDLVYMKLEDGPSLIHSKKGDSACWLTQEEATAHLWNAEWIADYYRSESIEVEAPKGNFSAIAKCSMGGEILGPVNWHGYQAALVSLHKSKYSRMPLPAFREKIRVENGEEAVAAWLEAAAKKTVWKPTREGADDIILEDAKSLEADFLANHFEDAYETADKVFVNCSTPRKMLSPGLAAHLGILGDKSRKFPQMVIPNLCHGLARHHLPIFKWKGNHFTGPSRIRVIPADMVLADRMKAIIDWAMAHSGSKVDLLFAELSGVPIGEDEAAKEISTAAYAPYVADMIWLLEQGFLVVTNDNSIWHPKGDVAPAPPKINSGNNKRNANPRKPQEKGKGDRPKGDRPKSDRPKSDKPRAPKKPAQKAEATEETPATPATDETPAPAVVVETVTEPVAEAAATPAAPVTEPVAEAPTEAAEEKAAQ